MSLGLFRSLIHNEYQEFLKVKSGRCVRLTTPPLWAVCLDTVGSSASQKRISLHGLLKIVVLDVFEVGKDVSQVTRKKWVEACGSRRCPLQVSDRILWWQLHWLFKSLDLWVKTFPILIQLQEMRLLSCKSWGFNGNDYDECHLLGYRNHISASQETHYVSATQSSQLMLCKTWGFNGGDYEECRLLGYKTAVCTPQETLRLHYRVQPVNAM
jgi:hypothetical protein